MRRLGWGLGVLAFIGLLAYLAFPRYQLTVLREGAVRFDRWTGHVEVANWTSRVSWLRRPGGATAQQTLSPVVPPTDSFEADLERVRAAQTTPPVK